MRRTLLLAATLLAAATLRAQEPLPKGMTAHEASIWKEYLANYPQGRPTTPPPGTPRCPAEWEENQAVVVTWTQFTSELREIVRNAKHYVKVLIVCSNSNSVQQYLAAGGVDMENIETITAPFNSIWVRDYGPQSIYLEEGGQLALVDWVYNRPRYQDDEIPTHVGQHLGLTVYQMTTQPNRLVATGGNYMADGFGKGFSSNLIVDENPTLTPAQVDTVQKRFLGVDPYIKMPTLPYDGIHHIDMHMKLLDEETLLVGQYPAGTADGPQIEANLQQVVANHQTPYGRPYKVVRIPMPADENGQYPNTWSDYLTYTNSVILNGLVLVPIYGLPQDDEALGIYRQAMPGYEVVGIDMREVIPLSGAIHCITHEIAANDPIHFSHADYRDTLDFDAAGYPVEFGIATASGVAQATLYWSADTTQGFTAVAMQGEQGTYSARIPAQANQSTVHYYVSATNNNGKTMTKPIVAPRGLYTLQARGGEVTQATLTVAVQGEGATDPAAGAHTYATGQTATLTATPADGNLFAGWVVDATDTLPDNPLALTMDADRSATALFTPQTTGIDAPAAPALRVYPNPAGESIRVEGAQGDLWIYDAGGRLVAQAKPAADGRYDIAALPAGVYHARVGGQTATFVKQ